MFVIHAISLVPCILNLKCYELIVKVYSYCTAELLPQLTNYNFSVLQVFDKKTSILTLSGNFS